MTTHLPSVDAVYLAQISEVPMRVYRRDGRWRLWMCDRGWRLIEDSIACFSTIGDRPELARVASWVAELIEVPAVELLPNPRRPGTYIVDVTDGDGA